MKSARNQSSRLSLFSSVLPLLAGLLMGALWIAAPAKPVKEDRRVAPDSAMAQATAESAAPIPAITEAEMRARLKARQPQQPEPTSVTPSAVPGLWEVVASGQVIYIDSSARYVFVSGELFDTVEGKSLTKERRDKLLTIDPAGLEAKKSLAMKRVLGDGSRTLYVFTDPLCPFCKRLEAEFASLKNVTLYVFLVPRPQAEALSKSMLCAENATARHARYVGYMLQAANPGSASCENAPEADELLKKHQALGRQFNVSGTPTMFNQEGLRLVGWAQPERLEKFLTERRPAQP